MPEDAAAAVVMAGRMHLTHRVQTPADSWLRFGVVDATARCRAHNPPLLRANRRGRLSRAGCNCNAAAFVQHSHSLTSLDLGAFLDASWRMTMERYRWTAYSPLCSRRRQWGRAPFSAACLIMSNVPIEAGAAQCHAAPALAAVFTRSRHLLELGLPHAIAKLTADQLRVADSEDEKIN